METTTAPVTAPVYEKVVKVPIERMLFEEPTGTILAMKDWKEDDLRLQYLRRIFKVGDSKAIFIACHLTPTQGCGRPARKILIPLSDGKVFQTTPRFVCESEQCLKVVNERGKLSTEIYPLSFSGLVEFVKKHPEPPAGTTFLHWLSKSLGLTRTGAFIHEEGLRKFFGLD